MVKSVKKIFLFLSQFLSLVVCKVFDISQLDGFNLKRMHTPKLHLDNIFHIEYFIEDNSCIFFLKSQCMTNQV